MQKSRISCTALAQVQDNNGRFCLRIAHKEGRLILRPLGGAFYSNSSGRAHLIQNFGASMFEDDRELRFVAPIDQIAALQRWFNQRQLREMSIGRILTQLLRDEMRLVTTADLRHMGEALLRQTIHAGLTARQVPVRQTQYLIEVFQISTPPHVLATLLAAASGSSPRLYFAEREEIREQMGPGGYVSSLARALLV